MRIYNLKMVIDTSSITIYLDNGTWKEPTHICCWNKDEWVEDAETVVPAMLMAIEYYHSGKHTELLTVLGLEEHIPPMNQMLIG